MKTKTLLVSGILMLVSFQSFAENGVDNFRKKVNSRVMYPANLAKNVDAQVYVEFTVLKSREIRIDAILSSDEEIRKSITEQIQNIDIDPNNLDIINKTFYYKFNLEVEK